MTTQAFNLVERNLLNLFTGWCFQLCWFNLDFEVKNKEEGLGQVLSLAANTFLILEWLSSTPGSRVSTLGGSRWWLKYQGPATHMGSPAGTPSSWFLLSPVPVIWVFRKSVHRWHFALALPLFLKQISEI